MVASTGLHGQPGARLTRAPFPPAARSAPTRPKPTTRAFPTWTVRSRAGPAASAPRAGGSCQRGQLAWLCPLLSCLMLSHQCPEMCLVGEGGYRALRGGKHSGSRLGAEGDAQERPECALPPASPLLPPASCEITTREYCDFMHGYFHEEATLCSQVSRAREAWQGMWDAMPAAMLMPRGCRVSCQEWRGWDGCEQGRCKVQGLAQLLAGLLLLCPPCWCGAGHSSVGAPHHPESPHSCHTASLAAHPCDSSFVFCGSGDDPAAFAGALPG